MSLVRFSINVSVVVVFVIAVARLGRRVCRLVDERNGVGRELRVTAVLGGYVTRLVSKRSRSTTVSGLLHVVDKCFSKSHDCVIRVSRGEGIYAGACRCTVGKIATRGSGLRRIPVRVLSV